MSDKIDMSGDFRGAIVNVKSHVKEATQAVQNISNTDREAHRELDKLFSDLERALETVPRDRANDAEKVALRAKQLAETAAQDKPDKEWLQITADGLKKAASAVVDVMPKVLPLAIQIADAISKVTR